MKFQYFGSYNGVYRAYPFVVDCNKYDARTRPWYNLAASGRKNIVILLDISSNMKGEKMKVAKSTISHIIERLNIGDNVALIAFNDVVKTFSGGFLQASEEYKNKLLTYVDELEPNGNVNYETAFRNAFGYYYNFDGKCQNIMIFVTFGAPATSGIVTPTNLVNLVNNLDTYKTTIFSYNIGFDSLSYIPRQIACSKNGIYANIRSENEIENALSSFYKLQYNSFKRKDIAWSEPYEDETIGTVVTISVPVYDNSVINTSSLLGVLAVDVSLKEMNGGNVVDQNLINKYVFKDTECVSYNYNKCQLEELRGDNKCVTGSSNCAVYSNNIQTCNNFDLNPFYVGMKQASYFENICCGAGACILKTDNAIYAGAIVGGIVGLLLIALLIWLILRCCKKSETEEPVEQVYTEKKNIHIEVNLGEELPVETNTKKKQSEMELISREERERENDADQHQLAIPQGDEDRI